MLKEKAVFPRTVVFISRVVMGSPSEIIIQLYGVVACVQKGSEVLVTYSYVYESVCNIIALSTCTGIWIVLERR